jgi:hypothetical protein
MRLAILPSLHGTEGGSSGSVSSSMEDRGSWGSMSSIRDFEVNNLAAPTDKF